MKQKMVVSNIRMPEEQWIQVKSVAADAGMSVNEYLKTIIQVDIGEKQLGIKKRKKYSNEKRFWDLPKLMKNIKYKPMGISDEDKIIYGV